MGPSGSGKSTLLNLISGIDRPDDGDVLVAGQLLGELTEDELAEWRARHVGLVFQFFNLIPVLSALDNVSLPLLLTDLDRAERKRRAETALRISSAWRIASTTFRAPFRGVSSSGSR